MQYKRLDINWLPIETLRKYVDQFEWVSEGQEIPSWQQQNISHRFEGIKIGDVESELIWAKQVHGIDILSVDEGISSKVQSLEADGLMTEGKQQKLSVRTADCLPILIYHPKKVWAIHAGWRGLASGILNTFQKTAVAASCWDEGIKIAIGPAIGWKRFEVGPELVEAFSKADGDFSQASLLLSFIKSNRDRWHLDLQLLAGLSLLEMGVAAESISILRSCTFENESIWHSYRRDAANSGRNYSWISL